MFTKEELKLIEAALTAYYLQRLEARRRQKAKSDWHNNVIKSIDTLQSKIWNMVNTME